ncbi:MAG: DUF748 domain-containing protein [Thermoguttaceae bacterium]
MAAQRNPERSPPVESPRPKAKATASKRRKNWPWWLFLTLVVLVVWLAPAVVAHTPLISWGLKQATADLDGAVSIGGASLGWFSPIEVQNVELKDRDGATVLTAASLESRRWLIGLLWNHANLGRFYLNEPKLSLAVRDNGSNVEDLVAKYLTETPSPKATEKGSASSTSWRVALEISGGELALLDQRTRRTWTAKNLKAAFEMLDGMDGPMQAEIAGQLPDGANIGSLSANLKISKLSGGDGAVKLHAKGVPLEMFRAVASRFAPGTTLSGRLSSELDVAWGGASSDANRMKASVQIDAGSFASPSLQTDVVRLERFRGACQANWRAGRVEIQPSSVECDLGRASLSGVVSWNEKTGFFTEDLSRLQGQLDGRIDLARLAHMMPATLRLRRQVDVQSGQVQVALVGQSTPEGMKWRAHIDADRLAAVASGRSIAWRQPLSLRLEAHQSAAGPVVDLLRCESDFLKINAAGTADKLDASWSFDLKQLSNQLGQFVDLGKGQFSGEGWGNLAWHRTPQRQFDADAELRLRNFQVGPTDRPFWREDDLIAFASAKGQTDLGVETRIDSATLSVKTAVDRLDARLAQPVASLRDGGAWPVHLEATGQLRNWPGRLAALLDTKDCRLEGAYTLKLIGTASSNGVDVRQAAISVQPLRVASPWFNADESQLDVTLVGAFDRVGRRVQIEPASLVCPSVMVLMNNVVLAVPAQGPVQLSGAVKYQGDAARVRRWFAAANQPSNWQIAGQVNGWVQMRQTGDTISGETVNEVSNLAVVDASGQQVQEPQVRLVARGSYDNRTRAMQIDQCELNSSALAANAAGRVAPAAGVENAQIDAQINYDLERLALLLRPYLGPNVRVVGRGASPAWYRGPLTWAAGQAGVGVRWDSADLYGVTLGPGELKAAMANGVVQVAPLDLALNGGRLRLAPNLRVAASPMELLLPKGPLAERIQIDNRMCAAGLKYIAPVLADAATVQGAFSIDLDDKDGRPPCRIPLSHPASGELTGRFTVHSIEVGPGPMTRVLSVFLSRETSARLRQESVVTFQMVNGRVYHQGLELVFPEFTLRTYGYVGISNQELAIMAELPVPPKWLQKNPALAQAMRNEPLRIPIQGTLSKPQLDQKTMAELNRKFLQKAAGSLIEGELNKQFDRLLGPKK